MGNKGSQVLVSEEKIDHTIKIIMDGGEMQDSNILVEGLKTIHICLERDEIYRWSKEAEIFIINNAIVKIFYHPHYEKVLVQFLDRYIEQQQKVVNQFQHFLSQRQWYLLSYLLSFLITFLNPSIKKFIDTLTHRSDIDSSIKQLIAKIRNYKNYTIPNILPAYQNRVPFFKQLGSHIYSLIIYHTGMSNIEHEFIIKSYMLYLQLYFEEDSEILQIVNEKIIDNFKIATYLLGVAVHQDNKKLFHACILFIESLINKRQTLPEISIVKLHKLTKIPIHNPQSVYHQILMLLIYQISAQQYHIKIVIKTMKVLMKIGKDRKIEGETKIFYYIELLCKKTALHCLQRIYLVQFIKEYTKMTKVSTKIIEEYKKVGDNHYTVKTDQGEQKYKKEDVREQIQRKMKNNGQEFEHILFYFIKEQMYKLEKSVDEPSQAQEWKSIILQVEPVKQSVKRLMEEQVIQQIK